MSKDKNMEKNSMKVEQKTRWHEEDLPSLIEEDLERSLQYNARIWALDFANPANIGEYIWNEVSGLMIQNAGDYRVRCILAIDCPDARIGLAMYKSTFNAIGVSLELGDYTIVAPDRRNSENASNVPEQVEQPGMEVV